MAGYILPSRSEQGGSIMDLKIRAGERAWERMLGMKEAQATARVLGSG